MVRFRLVTFNLLHHAASWPERAPHAVRGLSALAPDVVALQEVGVPDEQTGPVLTALAASSERSWYQASAVMHRPDGWSEGLAILSAAPILDSAALDVEGAGVIGLWSRLELTPGRPLDIFTVHLDPHDATLRHRQSEAALASVDELTTGGAAVLCGDFNAAPSGATVTLVRAAGFRSAHTERHGAEPARTFPTTLRPNVYEVRPGVCLDYIFVRGAFAVRSCRVALAAGEASTSLASDHAALVADLTWTPA